MKNPPNPKERNLLKGAMRRIFSRSELRRESLNLASIQHRDADRPRVTKWVFCASCGLVFPAYLAQVDHREPLVPVDKTLESMTWEEVVDRLWCDIGQLDVLDRDCHKIKTKIENKERRNNRRK